ncbi:MAG TPA: hypothetical protein VF669_05255, partial [Tepidisphaeraceae bacterium]
SYAIVIDKPILDLLKLDSKTPLEITTDGTSIIIAPANKTRRAKFVAAAQDTLKKYPKMLKRLAQ